MHHNIGRMAVRRAYRYGILRFAVALIAPVGATNAQAPGDSLLRIGTRVRIATATPNAAIGSRRAVAVVHAHTSDSITVAWDNGRRSTLSNSDIARLDTSMGPQPYVLRGMGVGFLVGAVAGAAIAHSRMSHRTFSISVEAPAS